MSGENVLNYFLTPNTGKSNDLVIGGRLAFAAGGYIKGDVGTGTSSSGAVTINAMAGVVTTESLTTAGGAAFTLTLTNSVIAAGDIVLLTLAGGTNTVKNVTLEAVAGAGAATVKIYNNTAATALNGTVILNFIVLKAA